MVQSRRVENQAKQFHEVADLGLATITLTMEGKIPGGTESNKTSEENNGPWVVITRQRPAQPAV
jgi:hypothetical protein